MFCDYTTVRMMFIMFSVNNARLRAIYLVHHSSHTQVHAYIPSKLIHIHTHVCTHTHTHQELAEQEGDVDKASSLAQQLEEIEERAEELDKQRTKGLSAIRSIPWINAHCHTFCCYCFNLVFTHSVQHCC